MIVLLAILAATQDCLQQRSHCELDCMAAYVDCRRIERWEQMKTCLTGPQAVTCTTSAPLGSGDGLLDLIARLLVETRRVCQVSPMPGCYGFDRDMDDDVDLRDAALLMNTHTDW